MKNYSVSITAFATVVVVQAHNKNEAIELASDQMDRGDFQFDGFEVKEIESEEDLVRERRHADFIVEEE